MEPLLYDLSNEYGNKRVRSKRIRAYEAAWARLQHDTPGFAPTADDQAFEAGLVAWLRFHRGMLIGEIIPHVYRYLRDNPAAPERQWYDHVLVDEYQDLNKAEQAVIDFLAGGQQLCIVGGDDQSLYSFKFAHPAGIREFPTTHAGTSDHAILECRRCPTRIVAVANALIGHNEDREPRQLMPREQNGSGEITIVQYDSLSDEAANVAAFVADLVNNQGYTPQEVLVLAQRRSIGNPIHEALSGINVPSKSYYQEGVLDNVAAQERLAILKLHIDSHDRIALRWMLGVGSNDFRRGAYARLRSYCENTGDEPWDAMVKLTEGAIPIPHTRALVRRFAEIRTELETLDNQNDLTEFVLAWLGGQIDDADPFHRLVADVMLSVDSADELLTQIIESVSQPDIPPDVTDVRIMSLHKSKGLSAPVVVIAGCVEGLLPSAPNSALTENEQSAALEEQRRLFFVGLTRVKADPEHDRPGILVLTSSRSMALADAMQSGIKPARVRYGTAFVHTSRFIQELGPTAPAVQRG